MVDAIIANPPYVRTQVLGANEAQRLAKLFGHTGRVDLYFAFLSCIARHLKPGGIAGVIVSNRFMSIKSGEKVREQLLQDFDILKLWDFGDTKLFEAAVLPVVLLLRRKETENDSAPRTEFFSIYSDGEAFTEREVDSVFDALECEGPVKVDGKVFSVRIGHLSTSGKKDGVWQLVDSTSHNWLNTVEVNTFCRFGDIGKIRVGVKTTADKVFIRSDWAEIGENVPELLRPLVTHHEAGQFIPARGEISKQILYTHKIENGRKVAVDLDEYPISKAYLETPEIRERLESRSYVIKAGRNWFEIWVPQDPSAWECPKLVFSDISETPAFWLEEGGRIVNGDCYWLMPKDSDKEELILLALAVGNSTFIERFYDFRFNNKLYAGRRRFMTQYVEEFPIPNPNSKLGREIVTQVKAILRMDAGSEEFHEAKSTIDGLVDRAFQVSVDGIPANYVEIPLDITHAA